MTSVPHSGAKSVTPGGSVAGGAGHTPGPWLVQRIDYSRGLDVSFEVRHYWSPDQPQHKVVAATHMEELRRDFWKVDEANAHLIAAAPELLAALREARDALHQHYVDWDGEPEDAVPLQLARAKCDEAIAKATAGETRNAEPIHRRDGDGG